MEPVLDEIAMLFPGPLGLPTFVIALAALLVSLYGVREHRKLLSMIATQTEPPLDVVEEEEEEDGEPVEPFFDAQSPVDVEDDQVGEPPVENDEAAIESPVAQLNRAQSSPAPSLPPVDEDEAEVQSPASPAPSLSGRASPAPSLASSLSCLTEVERTVAEAKCIGLLRESAAVLEVARAEIKAGKDDMKLARATVKILRKDLAFERELTDSMGTEHDHLMQTCVDQNKQIERFEHQIHSLTSTLSDKSEQLHSISEENSAMRQMLDDAEATIRSLSPTPSPTAGKTGSGATDDGGSVRSSTPSAFDIAFAKRHRPKFLEFLRRNKLKSKAHDPALHSSNTLEKFRRETTRAAVGRWDTT